MDNRIASLMLGQRKVLTNVALGHSNSALVGRYLFPEVSVDSLAVTIPTYGKDHFRIYNTERALRGKQKLLDPTNYNKLDVNLHEHGLGYPVDRRELEAAGSQKLNLEIYGTKLVKDAIDLGDEVRIADLVQDLNNFPTGNKVTLSGDDLWDDVDSKPINQIDVAKEAIRKKTGKYPNVMIIGHDSFNTLKLHKQITDSIYGVNKPGVPNIEQLQELLRIEIHVGSSQYIQEATGEEFQNVWGDNAILAYSPKNGQGKGNMFEPAFGYKFNYKGLPSVKSYWQDNAEDVWIIDGRTYSATALLMGTAGYLIKNTNS